MEQLLVQEARRAGARKHVPCVQVVGVPSSARELIAAVALGERLLDVVGKGVDHGVPDATGELQEVAVVGSEVGQGIHVDRSRIILIEDPTRAVVNGDSRIANWSVGRGY